MFVTCDEQNVKYDKTSLSLLRNSFYPFHYQKYSHQHKRFVKNDENIERVVQAKIGSLW